MCVCVRENESECERAGVSVSRLKWGASGKRESVINYLMFDINLKFIVVCIFSFARKSGTPPRWIIYKITRTKIVFE